MEKKIISVQVGQPKTVSWRGQEVTTSIFKHPVEGQVPVQFLGLKRDSQSDLKVHGGKFKAVYAYPVEHYDHWREELPEFDFQWGTFGENLTVSGLQESEVSIGDVMRIGTVLLKVSQPRFPCSKLGLRFESQQMIHKFLKSRRSGFYFEVLEEGALQTGDAITVVEENGGTSIRKFVDAYAEMNPASDGIQSILSDPHLLEEWRPYFEQKLAKVS